MNHLRTTIYRKWVFLKLYISWWWFARQWTRKTRRVKQIMDQRADAYAKLKAEVKRLRAIVDKLPLTADGVPVVPGMEVVWLGESGGGEDTVALHWWNGYEYTEDFSTTFSSLKAIRAAIRTREAAGSE